MATPNAAIDLSIHLIAASLTPSPPPSDPIRHVGSALLTALPSDPASVVRLSHARLLSHRFDRVPLCWRRCYEDAQLWLMLLSARQSRQAKLRSVTQAVADDFVRRIDLILMLTLAPARRSLLGNVLAALSPLYASTHDLPTRHASSLPIKRRRLKRAAGLPFPPPSKISISISRPLKILDCPSMTAFATHWHSSGTPVILTNTLSHWPALTQWQDPEYWLHSTHGGQRLVPVELGRMYTDDTWGQKVMTFNEFMHQHLCQANVQDMPEAGAEPKQIGYLAQHDLLSQIPKLQQDVAIPDYCYVDAPSPQSRISNVHDPDNGMTSDGSDSESAHIVEPAINIWLGPSGTISPAHTDPHHNILAQVMGRKYVRLYAPDQTPALYPKTHENGIDMQNTSSVDVSLTVETCDHDKASQKLEKEQIAPSDTLAWSKMQHDRMLQSSQYPLFDKADFVEGILHPGDCLFIPRGWWHYVQSLDVSASVSFWWD